MLSHRCPCHLQPLPRVCDAIVPPDLDADGVAAGVQALVDADMLADVSVLEERRQAVTRYGNRRGARGGGARGRGTAEAAKRAREGSASSGAGGGGSGVDSGEAEGAAQAPPPPTRLAFVKKVVKHVVYDMMTFTQVRWWRLRLHFFFGGGCAWL